MTSIKFCKLVDNHIACVCRHGQYITDITDGHLFLSFHDRHYTCHGCVYAIASGIYSQAMYSCVINLAIYTKTTDYLPKAVDQNDSVLITRD